MYLLRELFQVTFIFGTRGNSSQLDEVTGAEVEQRYRAKMANLQVFMLILIEVGSYASLRFCAAHGSDSLLSNKHSEKTAEKTEGKDCLSSKNDLNVKSFLCSGSSYYKLLQK